MSVRENLIAARALIDTPEKWGKGDLEPAPGCYCAVGAVRAVVGAGIFHPEYTALSQSLPSGWGGDEAFIADFNDDDDTSHGDILALFDRAIEASS